MTMGSRDFFWLRVSGRRRLAGVTGRRDSGAAALGPRPARRVAAASAVVRRQGRRAAGAGRLGGLLLDDVLAEGRRRPAAGRGRRPVRAGRPRPDGASVVYQVPLTLGRHRLDELAPGAGRATYEDPDARGPVRLRRPARPRRTGGRCSACSPRRARPGPARARARARPGGTPRPAAGRTTPARPAKVLAGEQSNTSIIVDADGERPVIVKVFRALRRRRQPRRRRPVGARRRPARPGCPRPSGWVEGWWPGVGGKAPVHGHLAFACEFLPGSRDAWREATRRRRRRRGLRRRRPTRWVPRPPRCTPRWPARCPPGRVDRRRARRARATACWPGSTGPCAP